MATIPKAKAPRTRLLDGGEGCWGAGVSPSKSLTPTTALSSFAGCPSSDNTPTRAPGP
jgi:hypothetical protein